jgi:hypothetical protein
MMAWRECTLGDVVTLKRGYDLPQRDVFKEKTGTLFFTIEGWARPGYEPASMFVSALSPSFHRVPRHAARRCSGSSESASSPRARS